MPVAHAIESFCFYFTVHMHKHTHTQFTFMKFSPDLENIHPKYPDPVSREKDTSGHSLNYR